MVAATRAVRAARMSFIFFGYGGRRGGGRSFGFGGEDCGLGWVELLSRVESGRVVDASKAPANDRVLYIHSLPLPLFLSPDLLPSHHTTTASSSSSSSRPRVQRDRAAAKCLR
jgi:hypothetical protein